MPEHNELTGAQLHPPQPLTFTGAVELYTPIAVGVLAVKTDVDPYALYLTTGVAAGDVALIGGGGAPDPDPDPDPVDDAVLLESGDIFELESGDILLLESAS